MASDLGGAIVLTICACFILVSLFCSYDRRDKSQVMESAYLKLFPTRQRSNFLDAFLWARPLSGHLLLVGMGLSGTNFLERIFFGAAMLGVYG